MVSSPRVCMSTMLRCPMCMYCGPTSKTKAHDTQVCTMYLGDELEVLGDIPPRRLQPHAPVGVELRDGIFESRWTFVVRRGKGGQNNKLEGQ